MSVNIFTINILDPAAYNSVLLDVYKTRMICDHENIVNVDLSFRSGNELWVMMPALSGHPIRSAIDHRPNSPFRHGLPANYVTLLLKQTLKALHDMHSENVLHGMIGADCIFIDDQTTLKLTLMPSLFYFRSPNVKKCSLYSNCCFECDCPSYADVELHEPRFPVWAVGSWVSARRKDNKR